jgi:uncharacterized protein
VKVSAYCIRVKLEEDEYLLINSRTGAVDLVDREVIDLLGSDSPGADPSITEFLTERGHITNLSPGEELEQMENLYKEYIKTHKKYHTHVIIPTYNCNLECPYCFLLDLKDRGKNWLNKVIDDTHIEKIFDIATEMDGTYRGQMALYGGEPLLLKNKPVIEKILHTGKMHGYTFAIPTNGVSVIDFLDILKEYGASLQITIDGPKEIHDKRRVKKDGSGTFDEIVAGIDAAVQAGLSIILRNNLDKDNIDSLPKIIEFYTEKDWIDNPHISLHFSTVIQKPCGDYQSFTPRKTVHQALMSMAKTNPKIWQYNFDIRGMELFENIFSKGELGPPRFWYCEANWDMLIYDPFGDIYVCWEHVGTDSTRVGRYYPELEWNDLYKVWNERTVFTIPECRTCKYALFCGGGCGFEAMERYGTAAKPVCYNYEEIFAMVIPNLYKSMKKSPQGHPVKSF